MILRLLARLMMLGAVAGAVWLATRSLGAAFDRRRDQRGRAPGGAMVRDRVCNTFLPRARALAVEVGAETHYFCSERCRQAFLQR